MTKKITVGYDGSAPSAEAVDWAANEASSRSAGLRIVCCYRLPVANSAAFGWPATEAVELLLEVADQNAKSIRAHVAAVHPDLEVSTAVSAGPADLALIDGAKSDDLIVVGASAHEGHSAFWLGSTPRQLVRHSPCPVAVVRGSASRGRPDRVVVGVDGSASSTAALEWAGDEADRHRVPLVLVHAWSYPYSEVAVGSTQARELMEVDAACVMDRCLEHARERFAAEVRGQLVEDGAVPALIDSVRDGDLLVLGSRGHGALVAGILGSTVNAVLDRANVPVVVVRKAAIA
jgi:nucleotide-binding universal stress UspA family protein